MKYQKIKRIEFVESNKTWVKVTFENGTEWFPDLIGLAQILSMIAQCEDMKYPNGEGGEYTIRFIEKCMKQRAGREEVEFYYDERFDPHGLRKR